jgi:hypothetical protein
MNRIVLACLLALLPFGVESEVFRCTDAKGQVVYQDYHCGPGFKQSDVDVTPAVAVPGKNADGKSVVSPSARAREADKAAKTSERPGEGFWERVKKWFGW